MSLTTRIYGILTLVFLLSTGSKAQLFTDQGVFSGSGLTVIPTATVVPSNEFRIQCTRLTHFQSEKNGLNVFGLSSGFSSTLEGYIRLTSEQTPSVSSQIAYTFGGKFRLPFMVPLVRRVAFWFESTESDMSPASTLYPTEALRYGAVATFDSNGIHPSLLLGVSKLDGKFRSLIGAGVTVATSHTTQVGLEVMHGYLTSRSLQVYASGSARLFPNISVQISPGYVTTSAQSSWMVSIGISCSTADIDFHPQSEAVANGEEFQMPSFEEIEKQSVDEKKNE